MESRADIRCAPVQIEQLTAQEIMMGTETNVGLITLCHLYLDFIGCDSSTRAQLDTYLDFIGMRATGEVKTPASWIRNFVRTHPYPA